MIITLLIAGILLNLNSWLFLIVAFVFGVVFFANVPPMQMRVMKYGSKAPELTATLNISAFNLANALGALMGGIIIDSVYGVSLIPFAALIFPVIGVIYIAYQEKQAQKQD